MSYPKLIEQLSYEQILANKLSRARAIDGWTAELESDPVLKLLEIVAYDELVLRTRINQVAISNLITYASASDLDAAAEFYQITRIDGETDTRLRNRLFSHIYAISGNGTHDYYLSRAKAAHIDVIDVVAYRLRAGVVNVAVWTDNLAALSAVSVALTGEASEMLGIDVHVYPAKIILFDTVAKIHVARHAPPNIAELIEIDFRASSEANRGFGEPLATSQIVAWLHSEHVEKVELITPNSDLLPAPDALWQVGAINLEIIR